MGMHSARRSGGALTTVASRGLFTATAAFALVGGSAGMAFAGEAPSHGHENAHGSEHGSEHGSGHGHGQNDCEIPIVDPGSRTVDSTVNAATGNATAPVLETGNAAIKPVHDALCPPAGDILGPIVGGQDEPATPGASSDDESAASEDESAPAADEGSASDDEGSASDEGAGGGTAGGAEQATGQPTITDIPAAAPAS